MEISDRLALSYVMASQAQKHVTVNETFRRLDALVQLAVLSTTLDQEPPDPAPGDAYILPAGKTGTTWDALADLSVAAFQDNAWTEIVALVGLRAYVQDEDTFVVFNGTDWAVISGTGGSTEQADKLGVNTTADTTNRLAVKSDAELLSHDDVTPGSGDARKIINKAANANVGSVLFQNGFSSRAEIGCLGNDNFSVQVSTDGSVWQNALQVNSATGQLGIGVDTPPTRWLVIKGGNADQVSIDNGGERFTSMSLFNDGIRKADWSFDNVANLMNLGTAAIGDAEDFKLYAANSDAFVYLEESSGNVGIGTDSPTAQLHVGGPMRCASYTVATVPDASTMGAGSIIFVTDETGGAIHAFSDGTDWRRMSDRTIIS